MRQLISMTTTPNNIHNNDLIHNITNTESIDSKHNIENNHKQQHREQQTHELFVCGRICLLGEHSDWQVSYINTEYYNERICNGRALIAGTNDGLYAKCYKLNNNNIQLYSILNNNQQHSFETILDYDTLIKQAQDNNTLFCYGCGVIAILLKQYKDKINGIHIDNYKTTLPIKSGLSSSAAYCVLIAKAFDTEYNLQLNDQQVMQIAYDGERLTGSKCGKLDQICAVVSSSTLVDVMFKQDNQLDIQPIQLHNKQIYLILVNLHGHKDTVKTLHDLNTCYTTTQPTKQQCQVQQLFGLTNQHIVKAADNILHNRHDQAITTIQQLIQQYNITQINNKQIQSSTISHNLTAISVDQQSSYLLGLLMCITQTLFDNACIPVCSDQLTAPKLHATLSHNIVTQHCYGGKWVGSGGDGSCQLIAKNKQDSKIVCDVLTRELNVTCLPITLGNNK